jgi:hypothetical protein
VPRTISGKLSIRPDFSGHTISNELLTSFDGSQSPSNIQTWSRLSLMLGEDSEIVKFSADFESGFFLELASGCGKRILVWIDDSLGYRPCALVLLRPERAAGMDEEHFPPAVLPSPAVVQVFDAGSEGRCVASRYRRLSTNQALYFPPPN